MRVLHVTNELGRGGAEAIVFGLIAATHPRITHCVVALHHDGAFGDRLREMGVPVDILGMPRGRLRLAGFWRLRQIIRAFKPDVVQTRLYHSDLLGGLAAFLAGWPTTIWGLHSMELGPLRSTWKTRVVRCLCAYPFRWLPSAIVADAAATAKLHAALGYSKDKMTVIQNGVDLSQFHRDVPARTRLREALGVSSDVILLGLVARWHPLKDHSNLLQALSIVKNRPGARIFRCALAGEGMTTGNADLMTLLRHNGLTDDVILLGPRADISAVMNALDLHVLSSSAESLPFAVIEAMACETPCVLTNVGDAAVIVGDTGWVVPPMAPHALATAIEAAMAAIAADGKAALGKQCRMRAVKSFGLEAMARAYEDRWLEAQHRAASPWRSPGMTKVGRSGDGIHQRR